MKESTKYIFVLYITFYEMLVPVSGLTLSILAGLTTGIGGLLITIFGRVSKKVLSFATGIASGMMLAVSFLSLLGDALELVDLMTVILGFLTGFFVLFILDIVIPHIHITLKREGAIVNKDLLRKGAVIILGVAMHNIPEGMAVALTYTHKESLGILVALTIGIHNVPEGAIMAIPLTEMRFNKLKVFLITLLSGITEPLFAFLTFLLFSEAGLTVLGFNSAFAAAAMVYITVDELIPEAYSMGHSHSVSLGLIFGIILSLYLLRLLA